MSSLDDFAIPTATLRHFDLASSPYSESTASGIQSRRRSYPDGFLFFDRLLLFAELDGPSQYPPTTPAALRRLLHSVHTSSVDRLKQDCFFYYLLRDYDVASPKANGHVGDMEVVAGTDAKPSSRAREFARRRCLSRTWRTFMDGYWSLDHALWDSAVSSLTDPSITDINFLPQVLLVLASLVSPPNRSCQLIHTFLTFTGRELESPLENDIRLLAMSSSSSMSQAFAWIRSRGSPEERVRMREAVWCWALGAPRSPCGTGNHGVQAKALKELLHLPLRPEENAHLVHFLSHPPRKISTPSLSLLHDLVTLRLVHQGQYAESLQLDRELAGSGGKEEDRQRRREQVREFIAILPEAQRRALLVESEAAASRKDQERGKVANGYIEPPPEDLEMGGSWIEVDESKDAESDRQMAAPTPIRPSSALLNIAQGVPLPASPAPPAPLPKARRDSPFSGPPRFARSPVPSSTTARVLSGSPFLLPKNAAASGSQKLIPKPPRQIINDDDNPVDQSLKRSTRGRSRPTPVSREQDAEMEDDGDEKEPPKPEETPASRRPNRRVTSHTSRAPPKEPTPPPSPPSTRTRRRQSTAPPPAPPTMPGAFTPESEPVLEDEEAPPAPRRASLAGSGSRSRPTRNASKAALDDEPGPTPSAKRTKSNTGTRARRARSSMTASEVTDDGPVSVRRSTRRGGTAQPSERGSPTPSVMSSVAGRSDTGRRRRVRGSQTPRMTTRSKKG